MSSNLDKQPFNLLTMKTMAERLRAALTHAEINQSELARRVGVTRGAVSLWFSGTTTNLVGPNLLSTAKALGVSPNWLMTGRGKMSPGETREISLEGNPDYPAIKRVNIKTTAGAAGYGIEPLAEDHAPIVFPKAWYEKNGYDPQLLVAIRVAGASMEPGMFEGDWVIINTGDITPRDGVVFTVNYDGDVVIRRLFRTDGQWTAASDNTDKRIYRDRPMNGDSEIIGRVVHKQSERI